MKERPILFSASMVRALLDDSKTQTRRKVKHPNANDIDLWADCGDGLWEMGVHEAGSSASMGKLKCPYGQPGDRLWVRETWGLHRPFDLTDWHRLSLRSVDSLPPEWELDYRADWQQDHEPNSWRPSIHMPRWASRLTLEVTGVRVERLDDISEADALAEGIQTEWTTEAGEHMSCSAREAFSDLWESIEGPGSWAKNPWVWVVSFKRL